MNVGPEHDAPRPRVGDDFSDAVTVAFADTRAELFGVTRLGLADRGASGLAIVFHRGEPVAVRAEAGVPAEAPEAWDAIAAAGLETETLEPLRAWRLRLRAEDAELDLELRTDGAVAVLDPDHPVARAGGMTGFEQAVRVTGGASVHGRHIAVDGLGQRGHSWGAPDWDEIAVARTVSAWLGDDLGVTLSAIRPAGARHHEAERIAAAVFDREPASGVARATGVAEPRLSTTYDGAGHQRSAGLELFMDGDALPRRAAGELVCGTTVDLGRLRLQCAFFRWRMEGRTGVGRYDVLARAVAT